MRRALLALAAAAWALSGCKSDVTQPITCDTPVLISASARANELNVLSLLLDVRTQSADSVKIRYGANGLDSVTPSFIIDADTARAFVLGLRPSTTYSISVVAYNDCGSTTIERGTFSTGQLPEDIAVYQSSGSDPAPGYIVFAAGNYGLVADNTGRIVWYRRFPNGPGLNFQAQPNGRFAARPVADPGKPGAFVEVAPTGEITRTLGCAKSLSPRMHDLIAQNDGSYWLLCDETRTVDLTSQGREDAKVTGTSVQHVSSSGELLFEWSPFDHLEIDLSVLKPEDFNGSSINWTHGNAIDLDGDGHLLVSYRNLNEVIKINTRTGAILWRLGGNHNDFRFENITGSPFSRQHGARALGTDGVILLDNLGEPSFSRAERYAVDEVSREARILQSCGYSAGLIAQIGGSAQLVADSHILVSFGNGAGVKEYDSSGRVVWQLDGNPGYVFRAQRISSLYSPGMGDPR